MCFTSLSRNAMTHTANASAGRKSVPHQKGLAQKLSTKMHTNKYSMALQKWYWQCVLLWYEACTPPCGREIGRRDISQILQWKPEQFFTKLRYPEKCTSVTGMVRNLSSLSNKLSTVRTRIAVRWTTVVHLISHVKTKRKASLSRLKTKTNRHLPIQVN